MESAGKDEKDVVNGFDLSTRETELTKTACHVSIEQEAETRVLVLYTGGTIGMKSNHQGGI